MSHQFSVDMHAKIEIERLFYIRLNQPKFRTEKYIDLRDTVVNGENVNPIELGKIDLLPVTFSGMLLMLNGQDVTEDL